MNQFVRDLNLNLFCGNLRKSRIINSEFVDPGANGHQKLLGNLQNKFAWPARLYNSRSGPRGVILLTEFVEDSELSVLKIMFNERNCGSQTM